MSLSKRQKEELEVWKYFIPDNCVWLPETELDVEKFFEWSEQGKHRDRLMSGDLSYFEALRQGKRWAGIHAHELYEKGVLDGTMPYAVILEGVPNSVVQFLSKEMFRGKDREIILRYAN